MAIWTSPPTTAPSFPRRRAIALAGALGWTMNETANPAVSIDAVEWTMDDVIDINVEVSSDYVDVTAFGDSERRYIRGLQSYTFRIISFKLPPETFRLVVSMDGHSINVNLIVTGWDMNFMHGDATQYRITAVPDGTIPAAPFVTQPLVVRGRPGRRGMKLGGRPGRRGMKLGGRPGRRGMKLG